VVEDPVTLKSGPAPAALGIEVLAEAEPVFFLAVVVVLTVVDDDNDAAVPPVTEVVDVSTGAVTSVEVVSEPTLVVVGAAVFFDPPPHAAATRPQIKTVAVALRQCFSANDFGFTSQIPPWKDLSPQPATSWMQDTQVTILDPPVQVMIADLDRAQYRGRRENSGN
jgi:hypothetical protein